jgi:hypothetical protein
LEKIETPWSDDQVKNLNAFQRKGTFHPFTCGNDRSDEAHKRYAEEHNEHDTGLLVAGNDGWRCPVPGCGYTQGWAHAFMAQELPDDPMGNLLDGFRNLDAIRKTVLAHMGTPDEVSLEPALEAMMDIEPGDTSAGWFVLGTIRYFFFLRRWKLDDPAYADVLDKFYSDGAASWSTSAEYHTKTVAAISAWYNFELPVMAFPEPEERPTKAPKKKPPTKANKDKYKKTSTTEAEHELVEDQPRSAKPKDDGLEKRMAKRIAKQRS